MEEPKVPIKQDSFKPSEVIITRIEPKRKKKKPVHRMEIIKEVVVMDFMK